MTMQTVRCSSHEEAMRALAGNARARFHGGGTLVMRQVNAGDPSFDTIVCMTHRQPTRIRIESGYLVIAADATMSDLLQSRDAACLHAAAKHVGGPAIRNMATVGGNLFAPSPYGDLATALLALDAELVCAGTLERMPLSVLLQQREAGNAPLVIEVWCKRPANPQDFRFHKVSRVRPKGISVLSIAAHLPGSSSTMSSVRVAYGAMAATPIRVPAVEQALESQSLNHQTIEAARMQAVVGLSPPADAIASSWYRQSVAPVHLVRLLGTQVSGSY